MSSALSNKKELIKVLDTLLLPDAFIRLKDDWYLDNGECVTVIGLGKSFYGGQFSLSMALLLKRINPQLLPHPAFHLCHFRQGFQFIVPDQRELKAALDLDNNLPAAERIHTLTVAIRDSVLPFLLPLCTEPLLAQEIKSNKNFAPYCRLDLKLALKSKGYLRAEDLRDEMGGSRLATGVGARIQVYVSLAERSFFSVLKGSFKACEMLWRSLVALTQ
jgi:hypothetical protein